MKIRLGFVSNSSSSSFVLSKKNLTGEQIDKIYAHKEVAGDDAWDISETENEIRLSTLMNNFNMLGYLVEIEVANEIIEYGI